jgi:phospholipase C
MTSSSRRRFLQTAASTAGAAAAITVFPKSIRDALAIPANSLTGTIGDVEHVVVFMQENRSFDHYFGHLRGVRGYNDRFPIPLSNGQPVWFQTSKETSGTSNPSYVTPFHLNTLTTSAQCLGDMDHSWYPTHAAINNGRLDQWPRYKTNMSMGYHLRSDIPFHYALADAFTTCDAYFCSLAGPTHPNRAYLMTGMVDPTAQYGGPALDNNDYSDGRKPGHGYPRYTWTTYPERLQAAGISWQVYQQGLTGSTPAGEAFGTNNYGTNVLQNFANFINAQPGSPLHERAQTIRTIDDLRNDVRKNQLPQVSWICPPAEFSEHPSYTPAYGAEYTAQILDALTSNPDVWSKTVLFIMYDENDGFFDHLPPPQVPTNASQGASTVDVSLEIHSVNAPPDNARNRHYSADNLPFGFGPRVPMTIVSPWSRGGFVCSQVFDHTSVIRFLEARFGVHEPNISPWRRAVSGDLTSAFDFSTPDARVPPLPDTSNYQALVTGLCALPKPTVPPAPGVIDPQEEGVRLARALPYELNVNSQVGSGTLKLTFTNTGRQGAHFYVYSTNRIDGPWRYTVEAGKSLDASFELSPTSGTYAFEVHGPNGFVRKFAGNATPATNPGATALPEVRTEYDAANGKLLVKFENKGDVAADLSVSDNAYGASTRTVTVKPDQSVVEIWDLASSHHWYDLSVSHRADSRYARRLAGHVENGKPSISDPAAVAPVTSLSEV